MTEKLTYEKALELAEQVIAERGADFTYSDGNSICAYVPTTDPRYPSRADEAARGAGVTGCIVGEVLKRADLLTDIVAGSLDGIGQLIRVGQVPATEKARVFLNQLQIGQDGGHMWGGALEDAKVSASLY